ncbi:hypothetical protein EMPS_10659 [Entomortierella parvispora]|uniref:Crinkler effector protein N-terminal domain-containing protein n=1 Tax=Entomortierella parvispora TaxID=205924 RepID=A0A9P3HKA4_9FUNG|nr:hypothetical protein EMPS_10659 [Entomortierella parvispora]
MEDTLALFCLISGEPTSKAFEVTIVDKDADVSDLKDDIFKVISNPSEEIKAVDLILWRVEILVKDDTEDETITAAGFDDKKLLKGTETLSRMFKIVLPDTIHVLVEKPKAKKRNYEEDDEMNELPSKRSRLVQHTWKHWLKELHSTVKIGDPPELYPIHLQECVGRFRKAGSQVPFSGTDFVDLRLNDRPCDMGKELTKLCKFTTVHVIFAVSGAGKTRSIFDVALREGSSVFLMYVECNDGSPLFSGDEPTGDRNFMRLYWRMQHLAVTTGLSTKNGQAEADRLIALEFTSRILHLILMFEKKKDLTPRDYLLSQLNDGQQSIMEISNCLDELDYDTLRIFFEMAFARLKASVTNFQFAIAIDEATVGSNLFDGQFKNHKDHGRGIIAPLLKHIVPYPIPVLIAGTSTTHQPHQHGRKVKGDIGKGVSENFISDYKPLSIAEVEAYIQKYLDFSDCDFTAIEEWKYLAGRPRLASRLLLETVQAEKNYGKSQTKQWILEKAVSTALRAVEGRLTTRLQDLAKRYIDSEDPCDSPMKSILEDLFISCRFFGGSVPLGEVNDDRTRLVNCGIAFVKTSPNGLFIKVDELVAVRTVISALSPRYFQPSTTLILNLFTKLALSTKALDTSKGKAWEYLIMSRLLDYDGKRVSDLVHIFYSDNEIMRVKDQARPKILVQAALPGWMRDATFKVSSFGDANLCNQMYNVPHEDDVDIIDFLIRDPARRNYILQPANIMRPDGVYIGSINGRPLNQYWTLLFSAKFFSAPMSGSNTIEDDRNSTKWALAYHAKTGIVSSQKLVDKLLQLNRFSDHQGSLRIHFVLPGLASSTDGSDRGGCRVEGDDVVMYIDETMLEMLFQPLPGIAEELRKLL